jgi:hypothetical protein
MTYLSKKYEQHYATDENLKSDGTATANQVNTNILVWESEISRAAEQPLIVNVAGYPGVFLSNPHPYPRQPVPATLRVFPSKRDQEQPKRLRNEGDTINTMF